MTKRTSQEDLIKNLLAQLQLNGSNETIELFRDDFKVKLKEFERDLRLKEHAGKTIKVYLRVANYLVEHFTSNEKSFDKEDMLLYKKHIKATYKNANTVNQYITSANLFIYYCGYRDATVKKDKIQSKSVIDEVITQLDLKRLLRWSRKMGHEEMYYLFKLLSQTGIRIEELKFYTVESIQAFDGVIQVENKGKKRPSFLPRELAGELRKYCKETNITSGPIWTISYSTVWRRMKKIAGKAKINKSKVHPHALRHYFAIAYLNGGGSITNLADLLGHSSLETTRIYTKMTTEGTRDQLDQIFKRGKNK